mgnify:CR=1 FL=1
MRHRCPVVEAPLPQDQYAAQLAEQYPGWDVWWSRRSGVYRARVGGVPKSSNPAQVSSPDLWELEHQIRQYRELTEGLRALA